MSLGKPARWAAFAMVLLMFGAGLSHAGQLSVPITVTVQLSGGARPGTAPTENGFCRVAGDPYAFGAIVTVACSTGAVVNIAPGRAGPPVSPMHGGAYYFLSQAWPTSDARTIDDAGGSFGTTTSWRVVQIANREYHEMMVAW